MKWAIIILLFFVIKSPGVHGQLNNPAFVEKKRITDSLVLSIDKNRSALVKEVVGVDSLFGEYKGLIYYTTDVGKPNKIHYDFLLDASGSKIFYYKNGLIKILDKGMPIYHVNGILLTGNGFVIDPISTKNLLYFEETMRNLFMHLFDTN